MGFADYRIKDSNERAKAKNSWKMLHLMSLKGGRLSLDELDTQKRNKFIKQKQETSSLLKKVFDQEEDPFEEYDKERNEYISKLKLISESEYQKDFRDTKIKDKSENNDPFKDLEESYSRLTEG